MEKGGSRRKISTWPFERSYRRPQKAANFFCFAAKL
jgi:hypothetical protein